MKCQHVTQSRKTTCKRNEKKCHLTFTWLMILFALIDRIALFRDISSAKLFLVHQKLDFSSEYQFIRIDFCIDWGKLLYFLGHTGQVLSKMLSCCIKYSYPVFLSEQYLFAMSNKLRKFKESSLLIRLQSVEQNYFQDSSKGSTTQNLVQAEHWPF